MQFLQIWCADHGGFVDDDGAPVDVQFVVFDEFERMVRPRLRVCLAAFADAHTVSTTSTFSVWAARHRCDRKQFKNDNELVFIAPQDWQGRILSGGREPTSGAHRNAAVR